MSDLSSQSGQGNSTQLIDKITAQQFLRFYLYEGTKAMLAVRQITEVLKIPYGQIVPIPQMPPWVMGVYNWRGNILWMVDLGHLIGLNPWYHKDIKDSFHNAIVLSPNKEKTHTNPETDINLGLVIAQVEDIQMCNLADIQVPSSSGVNSSLASFLQGYWLQAQGDMIMVLNGQKIIGAMPKNLAN